MVETKVSVRHGACHCVAITKWPTAPLAIPQDIVTKLCVFGLTESAIPAPRSTRADNRAASSRKLDDFAAHFPSSNFFTAL